MSDGLRQGWYDSIMVWKIGSQGEDMREYLKYESGFRYGVGNFKFKRGLQLRTHG